MSGFWASFSTVLLAIVGLAIVAVLVSQKAQTGGVIKAFFDGFGGSIGEAVKPVAGGGF